mmetsp:Transcript_3190/g.8171  ORF Transcript_3190/g.8171 Transcript_3190/m.8171 type:complete len:343 (+) Transcript_3190:29-1057(+)
MRVYLRHSDDFCLEVEVSQRASVLEGKLKASQQIGVPHWSLRLHGEEGQELQDSESLLPPNSDSNVVQLNFAPLTVVKQDVQRAVPHRPSGNSLFVFDLDETLTRSLVMSDATVASLTALHQSGARMAVASFNVCAPQVLQQFKVHHFFEVIVCGWNPTVTKGDVMQMVTNEVGWTSSYDGPLLFFFDDQEQNVEDVRAAFPLSYCVRVVNLQALPALISYCMRLDSDRNESKRLIQQAAVQDDDVRSLLDTPPRNTSGAHSSYSGAEYSPSYGGVEYSPSAYSAGYNVVDGTAHQPYYGSSQYVPTYTQHGQASVYAPQTMSTAVMAEQRLQQLEAKFALL